MLIHEVEYFLGIILDIIFYLFIVNYYCLLI